MPSSPAELLQLPFLFIASAHASLLAQEAGHELEARKTLEQGRAKMSRQVHNTFTEVASYCSDLAALVDALPVGAIMLDAQGQVRLCNDIAEEALDIESCQVINAELGQHPRLAFLKPYLDQASQEPMLDFMTIQVPDASGHGYPMGLGVYPVLGEDHAQRGVLIMLIPQGYRDSLKAAPQRRGLAQAVVDASFSPSASVPVQSSMPVLVPLPVELSLAGAGIKFG